MWHIVMFRKLCCKVGFSCTRLSNNESFKRLKSSYFAEFLFYQLNVLCKTTFRVPIKVSLGTLFSTFLCFCILRYKQWTRSCFNVKHQEFSPIKIKLKRCCFMMHLCIFNRNINRFSQTSTNAFRNCTNKFSLSRFLSVVNTENVRSFRWILKHFFYHSS